MQRKKTISSSLIWGKLWTLILLWVLSFCTIGFHASWSTLWAGNAGTTIRSKESDWCQQGSRNSSGQVIAIIDSENLMPWFPDCVEQASKHSLLARLVTSTVLFATPSLISDSIVLFATPSLATQRNCSTRWCTTMRRSWVCPEPEDAPGPRASSAWWIVPSRVLLLLLRPLVATPLKTSPMSCLLHRRWWRGLVKPNRQLQQPPPQGRRQEGVARVVPGPSH